MPVLGLISAGRCRISPDTFPSRKSCTATWSAQAAPPETSTTSGVILLTTCAFIAAKSSGWILDPSTLAPSYVSLPAVPMTAITFLPSYPGVFSATAPAGARSSGGGSSPVANGSTIPANGSARSGVDAVVIFSGAGAPGIDSPETGIGATLAGVSPGGGVCAPPCGISVPGALWVRSTL